MWNRWIAALACLLMLGGVLLAVPQAAAQTAKKKAKPAKKPYRPMADFSEGGLVGTSNAPAPRSAPITRQWLVGVWGLDGCNGPQFYRRIYADGRYSSADEAGSWALDPDQPVATFTYRREGDSGARGPHVDGLALHRDGDNRVQLNIGWWTRCSRDPDAPVPGLAQPARVQPSGSADGYTVNWERPGYCTLYLDTPRAATVRFSYQANGTTNFSYVRRGLALDKSVQSYPALFSFDGSRELMGYAAVDTSLDDGRAGFMLANAGPELLDAWGKGISVTIRFASVDAKPFDTIALGKSGEMVRRLKACAGSDSAAAAPASRPGSASPARQFEVVCAGEGEPSRYRVGAMQFDKGISCENGQPPVTERHDFGAAGSLYLIFGSVSATYGTGDIVRVPAQGPLRVVNIDYMAEFTGAPAIDRVRVAVQGVLPRGTSNWVCELRIDWRSAKILSKQWVSGDPGTRSMCTN